MSVSVAIDPVSVFKEYGSLLWDWWYVCLPVVVCGAVIFQLDWCRKIVSRSRVYNAKESFMAGKLEHGEEARLRRFQRALEDPKGIAKSQWLLQRIWNQERFSAKGLDRALSIALIYPILLMITIWVATGDGIGSGLGASHVGISDPGQGGPEGWLPEDVSFPGRLLLLLGLAITFSLLVFNGFIAEFARKRLGVRLKPETVCVIVIAFGQIQQ